MTDKILIPLVVASIIAVAGAIMDVQVLKARVQGQKEILMEIKEDVKFIKRHYNK